jgi:hypothetical protein
MTLDEHLAWCKRRANEYIATGDVRQAVTSMMIDLEKHPDTRRAITPEIALLAFDVMLSDNPDYARRFIEVFERW